MVAKNIRYRIGGTSKANRRKYRYGGSGILTNLLSRTVLQDNVKNLINSVSKSKLAQKVVEGSAQTLVKAAAQKGVEKLINRKEKPHRTFKSALQDLPPPIGSVVGSGIIYD